MPCIKLSFFMDPRKQCLWSCVDILCGRVKVGISCVAISETWVQINGQLQSLYNLGQIASSAWKWPKTQFWGPLTENLNPLPGPMHTLTPSSVNTQNMQDLSWHALNSMIQVPTLLHWKARICLPVAFNKISDTALMKPSPVSERSAYPLQKYACLSLLTSWLQSFGHKSTPSERPWIEAWIEAYCPKFC